MHDHNLEDLIVEPTELKQNKSKNILTIFALFIVLLIVTIIATKSLLNIKDNKKSDFETTKNSEVLTDPKLKLKEPEQEELSTIIEDNKLEEKSLSKNDDKKIKDISLLDKNSSLEEKDIVKKQVVKITKEFEESDNSDVAKVKNKEIKKVEKKSHTKKTTHIKHKRVAKKTIGKYYIQVGSFRHRPTSDSRLIEVIKKNRYRFTIYKTTSGLYKVLVGPYRSRRSANVAIVKVKDRINKSAYIFKK